jgi:hypothetical protein
MGIFAPTQLTLHNVLYDTPFISRPLASLRPVDGGRDSTLVQTVRLSKRFPSSVAFHTCIRLLPYLPSSPQSVLLSNL